MIKLIFTLATLGLTFGNNVIYAQNQFEQKLRDKSYNFCRSKGYSSTDAYMETQELNIAICTLPTRKYDALIDVCYVPSNFFMFIQVKRYNRHSIITTNRVYNNQYYPNSIYTFRATHNGLNYQLQTSGGSNNYDPENFRKHFTSFSIIANNNIIYQQRVNYYFGDIGMGC